MKLALVAHQWTFDAVQAISRLRAHRVSPRVRLILLAGLVAVAVSVALLSELQTSWLQSRLLAGLGGKLSFTVTAASEGTPLAAPEGPYDRRLGYSRLPSFVERLTAGGRYRLVSAAHPSENLRRIVDHGLFPIYPEKTQAGLRLLDRDGCELYATMYPERVYASFDDVPPVIVQTVLFLEDRNLLDDTRPFYNPAVAWHRFALAGFFYVENRLGADRKPIGASTLATQLEKVRHSPGGLTSSPDDKLRQMATASVRAYLDGPMTFAWRRQVLVDYLNSIPLAATRGYGEVTGLVDGLRIWFDADVDRVHALLTADESSVTTDEADERARAYRQALSLLLAIRRPSWYLAHDREGLDHLVNQHLRLLARGGIISPGLRDRALRTTVAPRTDAQPRPRPSFVARKGANAVRPALAATLGLAGTHELDRLDLAVRTTLDATVQNQVTDVLRRLADPQEAAEAGLRAPRLLGSADPGGVVYSFTLYERTPEGNLLRVQADTHDQPLNVNESTKLELGSTAKLRTLVTYLDIVATLHGRYAGRPPAELRAVAVAPRDRLTAWALSYLVDTPHASRAAMLEAALDRRYSASPAEVFYTGAAPHRFSNFDAKDNSRVVTVREAFRQSINLPFIRLLRDIVAFQISERIGPSRDFLDNRRDERRLAYLERFADWEGRVYLQRFTQTHVGLSPEARLSQLARGTRRTPVALAAVFRFVRPEATLQELGDWLATHVDGTRLSASQVEDLYERYGPDRFTLEDRAYLARVHPLELWLAGYLRSHPAASLDDVYAASVQARQDAYRWLLRTSNKRAQDLRINTVLEQSAFEDLHRAWQRLGYPFSSLVPSLATAIGSSGDTPAALAELTGILLDDGVRLPALRIQELRFAASTPYERVLARTPASPERVLDPEVAAAVRQELFAVVEHGTGRRAAGAIALADGTTLKVGGKTGTGDNRIVASALDRTAGPSRVLNRTGAFVFVIDDRFYGAITAYATGDVAADYRFTSALPVQVFTRLTPALQPLLER